LFVCKRSRPAPAVVRLNCQKDEAFPISS
jgi:hypothetical protein